MTHDRLVLASASPRRRELLASLGIEFDVEAADVDESRRPGEPPTAYARRLAEAKARRVADGRARGLVLGSDTIVVDGDDVLGKPADGEEARAMLRRLAGRRHEVITAVALVDAGTGRAWIDHETTSVWMRRMSEAEIAAYADSGDPLDKAGGYAIQNDAHRPVERIDGPYDNVVGLPLALVARLLSRARDERTGAESGPPSSGSSPDEGP